MRVIAPTLSTTFFLKTVLKVVLISIMCLSRGPAAQAQNKLVYITVEGLDILHLIQPEYSGFREVRERIAIPDGDLGTARAQSGYISRRFANGIADLDTLFQAGELAVVNKVGFSERVCSHKKTRELLGRGVDREDHPHLTGWVTRLASAANFTTNARAWDITCDGDAFVGGDYTGNDFCDFNAADLDDNQFNNFNDRDSRLREKTIYNSQSLFTPKSGLAERLIRQSNTISEGLATVRPMDGEDGAFNDILEDIFGRAEHIITNNSFSGVVVARVPASFGYRNGTHGYTFDTFRDQRDTYSDFMDNLENGIRELVQKLKDAPGNLWEETIIVVVPDYGRGFRGVGILDEDDDDNNGDSRGTNCGHAGDALVLGATDNIRAGFYGPGYSGSELRDTLYAVPNYTHTQLLYSALLAIGMPADQVIDREGKACLSGLFDNGC